MNELVKIENNQEYGLVVSSRVIADRLGKQHKHVIRDLEQILESPNLGSVIIPSFYKVKNQNREYKEYLLTKDGFTLYMFNIQGHNDFKMAYINKFNEMSNQLAVPSLPQNLLLELVESQKRFMQQATALIQQSAQQKELPAPRKRKSQNKRPLLLETFPQEIQEVVDVLASDGYSAGKIKAMLKPMGYSISENAVRRFIVRGGK